MSARVITDLVSQSSLIRSPCPKLSVVCAASASSSSAALSVMTTSVMTAMTVASTLSAMTLSVMTAVVAAASSSAGDGGRLLPRRAGMPHLSAADPLAGRGRHRRCGHCGCSHHGCSFLEGVRAVAVHLSDDHISDDYEGRMTTSALPSSAQPTCLPPLPAVSRVSRHGAPLCRASWSCCRDTALLALPVPRRRTDCVPPIACAMHPVLHNPEREGTEGGRASGSRRHSLCIPCSTNLNRGPPG